MRNRNFTIDEAVKLNDLVAKAFLQIKEMPFGKRIKSLSCEVDDNADPTGGFPEIRVHSDGKLSDSHLRVVCGLANEFSDENVRCSKYAEKLGVRVTVTVKIKLTIVTFRWIGLRKIDTIQPLDYFYADGTFAPVFIRGKKAEGVVYYADEKEIRIVSPQVSAKIPWAEEKCQIKLSSRQPEINPFGIFEADQPMEDLNATHEDLMNGVRKSGKRLYDFPALNYVASCRSEFFKKGDFRLPLPGDAMHLFSREKRAELSRKLRQIGGKGLCRSCWLGTEFGEGQAYMVQLTTANSMIKNMCKSDYFVVFPVVTLDWKSVESLGV
jgi:hypothetical protein